MRGGVRKRRYRRFTARRLGVTFSHVDTLRSSRSREDSCSRAAAENPTPTRTLSCSAAAAAAGTIAARGGHTSRTSHFRLRSILPWLLSAPIALAACGGNRTFNTTDNTPITDLPVDLPIDPAVEGQAYSPANAPPAVSGGTLLALKDGVTAVAADPDRDRVWIVDTDKVALRGSIALKAGDEPGRSVEDGVGRVWTALRRGGAVVTLDVPTMTVTARTPVCPEPRGLAYDAATDRIHVACVGGELVTFDATTGKETRRLRLDRDLRDVLIDGAGLRVSRFRSAELLSINASGIVTKRVKPPSTVDVGMRPFDPAVAWRTVGLPGGGVATLHQTGLAGDVPSVFSGAAYYADPCAVIVHTAVTVDDPAAPQSPLAGGLLLALAVDIAIPPDGQSVAIASAGEDAILETSLSTLQGYDATLDCSNPAASSGAVHTQVPGTPIAVAYDAAGQLVVQTREPPSVWVFGRGAIPLPGETRRDIGHELVHSTPAGGIACASCHPEGREDGRT